MNSRIQGSLLIALAALLNLACEDTGPRVFTAQRYDAETGCLEYYSPIGLVTAGDFPGDCAPTCLDLDGELYVSTLCGPFPDTTFPVLPEESEVCVAALQAATNEAYCE